MRRTRGVLLGLIATLFGASLAAQQVPPPGARVRVVDRTGEPVFATGTFVRLAGDTVVLTDSAGAMHAVTLELGRRWERGIGMKRRTLHGAAIGAAIGGGLGLLAGLASAADGDAYLQAGATEVLILTAIGGGAGTGIGAAIGASAAPAEKWRTVPRDDRLHVTVGPARGGGLRLGVSRTF